MESSDWLNRFEGAGVLWRRSGDGDEPHVELTSKRHTAVYFDAAQIVNLAHGMLYIELCRTLGEKIANAILQDDENHHIDYIVVPKSNADQFAPQIMDVMKEYREVFKNLQVRAIPVQKNGGIKKVPEEALKDIRPRSMSLFFDDVLTTSSTFDAFADAFCKAGAGLYRLGAVIVNRSGSVVHRNRLFLALVEQRMPDWPAESCPLCRRGSIALPANQLLRKEAT